MDGRAYLRQFYNQRSFHKRLAMIRQARKGGAVTPEAYVHLQPFILSGQVDVKTYCEVQTYRQRLKVEPIVAVTPLHTVFDVDRVSEFLYKTTINLKFHVLINYCRKN